MSLIKVSILPKNAADLIYNYVLSTGISAECVGYHNKLSPEGNGVIMLVFEKYFIRNSSRASLSVIIENLDGTTTVYSVGSGGGKGVLLSYDWGASKNLIGQVEKVLADFRIE